MLEAAVEESILLEQEEREGMVAVVMEVTHLAMGLMALLTVEVEAAAPDFQEQVEMAAQVL